MKEFDIRSSGAVGDGVIQDCSFSDLKIRDSVCGIGFLFPTGGPRETFPDQGREATIVEDMSFSDMRHGGRQRVHGQLARRHSSIVRPVSRRKRRRKNGFDP